MANYIAVSEFKQAVYKFLLDKYNAEPEDVYEIWQCKTIQNHKGIFGIAGSKLLFECTFNGDANELYVDTYKKTNHDTLNDFS